MERSKISTPCFVLHEVEFIKNIDNFQMALKNHFNDPIMGYSFKTNPLPRLLYLAKENGCWAEVVSDDEYRLAEEIGFPREKIIFNGPVKGKDVFLRALDGDSIVNIDSHREIGWLIGRRSLEPVRIGVRVNFDLEGYLPGQTSTNGSGGRFGFCLENGELHNAIKVLHDNGIAVSGLHMHMSNASRSPDIYSVLTEKACQIISEESLDIRYIDLGGGYFGGGDDGERYAEYVSVVHDILKRYDLEGIQMIVEPGASVVATAFSYISSVIDVKQTTYDRFVVTDGSRLHIDPFMKRSRYVYRSSSTSEPIKERQVICGYTCMENDRIMTLQDINEFKIEDQIEYDIVGSYTMCFNPLFISFLPRVYGERDGIYQLIREKWEVGEFLQKNRWS